MGPPSALIGNPPLTESDLEIVKGLQNLMIAAAKASDPTQQLPPISSPENGFPLGTPRPPPSAYRLESRKPHFITAASVTIVVMVLFTGSRLAIRAQNAKLFFGMDDLAIIFGTFLALAVPALLLAQVAHGGLGKHIYDCTYHELYVSHMLGATQTLLLFEALGFIKLSIVLLYMRMSGFTSKKWMVIHWTLLTVLSFFCLAAFFVMLFTCSPAGIYWDLRRQGQLSHSLSCMDQSKALAVLSAVHVCTDFSLLVIPVALLWRVQMKWTRKLRIWLAGIFGLSSCTFALLRTITQYVAQAPDPTYAILDLTSYVLLDVTTALIAASLPVLSALVTRIRHKYHDYRSPGQEKDDLQLEGQFSPRSRRPRHYTNTTGTTRLDSCSSSETGAATIIMK